MTHEQNLKTVREAVIRAVPEIMELKFGCHLKGGNIEYICLEKEPHKYYEDVNGVRLDDPSYQTTIRAVGCKILGRPILLTDVLFAIPKTDLETWISAHFFYGRYRSGKGHPYYEGQFDWNLRADDLTAQSPECVAFLAELLR